MLQKIKTFRYDIFLYFPYTRNKSNVLEVKQMIEYLKKDFKLARKPCRNFLSSIFLIEMTVVYKCFEKKNLLHLPLRNFSMDLVALLMKNRPKG